MGKFRETLWFKRGDLVDLESDDERVELPVEDRYVDTGDITYTESVVFGLHSGQTAALPRIDLVLATETIAAKPELEFEALIRELQPLNTRRFAMLGLAMLTLCLCLAGLR